MALPSPIALQTDYPLQRLLYAYRALVEEQKLHCLGAVDESPACLHAKPQSIEIVERIWVHLTTSYHLTQTEADKLLVELIKAVAPRLTH